MLLLDFIHSMFSRAVIHDLEDALYILFDGLVSNTRRRVIQSIRFLFLFVFSILCYGSGDYVI